MPLLELDEVVVAYGKVEALRGLTLRVDEGEIIALLGSNGAGKSTTLRAVSGLVQPRSGALRFAGHPLARRGPESIVRLGIAHVPEGRRIFPGLTVRENILLGASNRGRAHKAAIAQDLDRMFGIFPDIRPFADALGWTLSGGQQQMVAIARALMAHPRLLLLDEPSLGLSPLIVVEMFEIVRAIHAEGVAILLVEQNVARALDVASRAFVLEEGRIVAEGDRDALLADPRLRRAYLGVGGA